MKTLTRLTALTLAVQAVAALAQPVAIARDASLFSADGRKIGRVERVIEQGGTVTGVRLIVGGRMVTVPGDTITAGEKGPVTSLTLKQVKKLQ